MEPIVTCEDFSEVVSNSTDIEGDVASGDVVSGGDVVGGLRMTFGGQVEPLA